MRLARPAPLLLALVATFAPAAARADGPFYLKDGDRVVFYGDSITDQRLYTTFTETFVVTRFPKMKVDFVHSGWGGDRVGGGGGGRIDVRLDRDVIAYKPTVVTIMLGMNDASYRAFDQKIFDTYSSGYRHIVDKLKHDQPGLRLTLIVPSPFDDVCQPPRFEGGYNSVLLRYGDFVKELARGNGATVADLNTPVVEATRKAFASDPVLSKKLNPDRIHPGPGGQLLMSAALLKAWDAPSLVSSVTIEKNSSSSVKAEHATIQAYGIKDNVISWNQLDDTLPFPIDLKDPRAPEIQLAVDSSHVMEDLNRQILRVLELEGAQYTLKIDGKEIGTFTKGQLNEGVNLARYNTPMLEQAKQVHALTLQHNNTHFQRWRGIEVPLAGDATEEVKQAIDSLDLSEARIVALQRKAAIPKPHKFEIAPKD
jgi:lysophospholipase L1-like esterase